MPSGVKIFVFVTSIHGALSGPLPRYTNATAISTTSTSIPSSTASDYSRHEHSVVDLSLDVVPTSSSIPVPNTDQTSSAATTPAVPLASAMSSAQPATTTSQQAIFSYQPAHHNGNQTSASTTTLTLWTTLPYRISSEETKSSTQPSSTQPGSGTQMSTYSQLSSPSPHRPTNISATTMYGGNGGPKATTTTPTSSYGTDIQPQSSASDVYATDTATTTLSNSLSSAASSSSGETTAPSISSSTSSRSPVVPFPQTYTFNSSGGPDPQSTTDMPAPPGQSSATATVNPVSSPYTSTSRTHRRPSDSPPTPTFSLPEIVTQRPPQGGTQGHPTSAGVPGITIVPVDPNKVTVTVTVSVPSWTTTVAGQTVTVTA